MNMKNRYVCRWNIELNDIDEDMIDVCAYTSKSICMSFFFKSTN